MLDFPVTQRSASHSFLVSEVLPLFQAFVAPAIFVSASALLLLSLNTGLMGMVSRLRPYLAWDIGRWGASGAFFSWWTHRSQVS